MKKVFCLITLLLASLNGCAINYSSQSVDETLIQNTDGTYTKTLSSSSCDNLEVYYLDLKANDSQTKIGDSTYIKCNNIDIIIDAGIKNVGSTTIVPFLKEKVTDKTIDITVITHTDNDHIGGFVGLSNQEGVLSIENFTYNYIIESGYEANTEVYKDLMNLTHKSNAKICTGYEAITGLNECPKNFKIGTINFEVLNTGFYNDSKVSSNNRSIVTLLTHNEISYLFPGDLEDDLYLANSLQHVDIFKASHHGALSANSKDLLEAIKPEVIIISTGLDGDTKYGIPQQKSLDNLYSFTKEIYATFTTGTIKITSNGTSYTIECNNKQLFQNTDWFLENRVLN